MKIDYVLVGSTENPLYLDFWPVISDVWKRVFNITPVLGLITNENSELYDDGNGLVVKFKQTQGQDAALSSQIVRMYLPKFLDGNCIISDIDMIPTSIPYFINQFEQFSDEDILVLSSHHWQTKGTNQYPMCYVAGNSKKLSEIFNLNGSWDEFYWSTPKEGWSTDQTFLYRCIENYGIDKVKFPYRSFNNDRIDRPSWGYDINRLKNGDYVDAHLLRPYSQYKEHIDNLILHL
jgi:hypothetical protein